MKKTKVLVTGCFDVLHSQHRKLLKAAKKQGDILLVGLESDARVRKLKGSHRPLNPLKLRLKNLQALNIADFCFPLPKKFSKNHHHQALIKKLRPDILAISSHTPNQKAKRTIIEKYGGKIKVVLKHNPKLSTTKLIKI